MTLTVAQHQRLDKLAVKEPHVRVIGWHHLGPVVRRAGGVNWIDPNGRLRVCPGSWTK